MVSVDIAKIVVSTVAAAIVIEVLTAPYLLLQTLVEEFSKFRAKGTMAFKKAG